MIKIRNNNIILYFFLIITLILQIIFMFKNVVFFNYVFINNYIHLFLTVPITLWGYSLIYRITDKKVRYYSFLYVLLLLFWLIAKFCALILPVSIENLIFWYLYYIPLLFNVYLLYEMLRYSSDKLNYKTNYFILIITIILILSVLTNNYHNNVFIIDINYLDKYTYGYIYSIIVIWLIILGILILNYAFRIYKNRNKAPLLFVFLVFILYFIYNRAYVFRINLIFRSDFTITTIIFMVYLLEVFIRINLIPGKYYYSSFFKMENSNLSVIDNDFNLILSTNNLNSLNEEVLKSINPNLKSQEIILDNKDIVYKIDKIDGGYSISIRDLSLINNLIKQINNKTSIINRQNNILLIEEELSKKHFINKVSTELKNKVDNILLKKIDGINYFTEMISGLPVSVYQDYRLLSYIKIYIGYCKNKSSLILKEVNNQKITGDDFSIILHNTIQDSFSAGINGQIFVNVSDYIDMKYVQLFFDVIQFLLEKCIRFNKTSLFIRIDKKDDFYTYYSIIDTYDEKGNFIFEFNDALKNNIKDLNFNCHLAYDDTNILITIKSKEEVIENG